MSARYRLAIASVSSSDVAKSRSWTAAPEQGHEQARGPAGSVTSAHRWSSSAQSPSTGGSGVMSATTASSLGRSSSNIALNSVPL